MNRVAPGVKLYKVFTEAHFHGMRPKGYQICEVLNESLLQ